jgi:hypothetical protein
MNRKVEAQVCVTLTDRNDNKLLWQIGTVCIKVCGRLGPLPDPVCGLSDDVFIFAATIKTHCQLHRFCGQPLTDFKMSESTFMAFGVFTPHWLLCKSSIFAKRLCRKLTRTLSYPPSGKLMLWLIFLGRSVIYLTPGGVSFPMSSPFFFIYLCLHKNF